jgi:hypothetical protein
MQKIVFFSIEYRTLARCDFSCVINERCSMSKFVTSSSWNAEGAEADGMLVYVQAAGSTAPCELRLLPPPEPASGIELCSNSRTWEVHYESGGLLSTVRAVRRDDGSAGNAVPPLFFGRYLPPAGIAPGTSLVLRLLLLAPDKVKARVSELRWLQQDDAPSSSLPSKVADPQAAAGIGSQLDEMKALVMEKMAETAAFEGPLDGKRSLMLALARSALRGTEPVASSSTFFTSPPATHHKERRADGTAAGSTPGIASLGEGWPEEVLRLLSSQQASISALQASVARLESACAAILEQVRGVKALSRAEQGGSEGEADDGKSPVAAGYVEMHSGLRTDGG